MPKVVVRNMPFTTIYNSQGKTEFVIMAGVQRIRVESKYQCTSGSVYEKYPYMLLNAIYQYVEREVILVVDGGGYKPGARQWIANMLMSNWMGYREMGKSINLFSIAEFVNWFNSQVW